MTLILGTLFCVYWLRFIYWADAWLGSHVDLFHSLDRMEGGGMRVADVDRADLGLGAYPREW
jgi:hypothetical protein